MELIDRVKIVKNGFMPNASTSPPFNSTYNQSTIAVGDNNTTFGINIDVYDTSNILHQIKITETGCQNELGQGFTWVEIYEAINKLPAVVYPPPDTITLKVVDNILVYDNQVVPSATSQSQLTSGTLNIQDINGYGTRSNNLDAGSMTISDGASMTTYIDAGDWTLTSTGSGDYTTANPSYIQANSPSVSTLSQINPSSIQMADGVNNLQVELSNDINVYSEPFLRLRNQNGSDNYLRFSELNVDQHINFSFNNNQSFFRQMNPFSFNTYNANDGDFIEKFMPFVVADNITTLKLHNPSDYLDNNGNYGWSCIVSNISGGDVQIDTSGYQWYAHSNGLQGGPIDLNKWSTARLTLVFSYNTVGDYVWALSQF